MSTTLAAPTRALFTQLIDYAGLFPPAKLSMNDAVAEYDAARTGPYAWMLGRFIVPATRVDELLAAISARDSEGFALSIIVDAGDDPQAWFGSMQTALASLARMRDDQARVRVDVLEIPLPPLRTMRDTYDAAIGQCAAALSQAGLRQTPAYVEVPRDDRGQSSLPALMTSLSRYRLYAKIRCGGVTSDAFPTCAQVAAFIDAGVAANVPFKATAGLHHPVRAYNAATGFTMHGFLNLLAATAVARAGAQPLTIEAALAEEDPKAFRLDDASFAWRDRHFDTGSIAAVRNAGFVAYGSCSFDEPVADLTSLGMLGSAP